MEPIPADLEFFVQLVRQPVQKGLPGHGLVKGGVEHGHLGNRRGLFPGHPDPGQVGRIVERRQGGQLLDGPDHLLIDQDRFMKPFPAMHHPVANGGQLGHMLQAAALPEHPAHQRQGRAMVGHRLVLPDLSVPAGFIPVIEPGPAPGPADVFHQAAADPFGPGQGKELKLQG